MIIVAEPMSLESLVEMARARFGELVKAVVDVDRGVMAVDAEMHSDEEALLLEDGSQQKSLWGVNIYPEFTSDDRLEFDSMINIRPSQGNRSRGVDDEHTRVRIRALVDRLISP
jgi:hypothetical protein